jgi:hypothetical protein
MAKKKSKPKPKPCLKLFLSLIPMTLLLGCAGLSMEERATFNQQRKSLQGMAQRCSTATPEEFCAAITEAYIALETVNNALND